MHSGAPTRTGCPRVSAIQFNFVLHDQEDFGVRIRTLSPSAFITGVYDRSALLARDDDWESARYHRNLYGKCADRLAVGLDPDAPGPFHRN